MIWKLITVFLSPSKQIQSFPSALSTKGSRFFIGSRGQWRGRFTVSLCSESEASHSPASSSWFSCLQGLLRQLVLLPGSDARPRLCPNSEPSLAELSVPHVLKSTPLQPDGQGPLYPYGEDDESLHELQWFLTEEQSLTSTSIFTCFLFKRCAVMASVTL